MSCINKLALGTVASLLVVLNLSSSARATPPEKLLNSGKAMLEAGKFKEAQVYLEKAIVQHPNDARLHFLLGWVHFSLMKLDKAVERFNRAIDLDPKQAKYYGMKGTALLHLGKRQEAVAALKRSIDLDPAHPQAWHVLGNVHFSAKEYDLALGHYKKALSLDPKHVPSLLNAGAIMSFQDKHDTAVKYWLRAIAVKPNSDKTHYNLGLTYQRMGKNKKALKHYIAAARLNPGDWRATEKLVQVYQALNRPKLRDAQRAKLFARRKAGKIAELSKASHYCRDKFRVGTKNVRALEHFELKGKFAKRYSFMVMDKSDKVETYEISLGSYEDTNAILGSINKLKKGEVLFHLDGYFPEGRHETYGFIVNEPPYDIVKRMVIDVITGKREAQSGYNP